MLLALLTLMLLLTSEISFSFPELLKEGYQVCSACHLSESGGGALTQYGRSLSEEVLSTWSYGNEGQVGHFDSKLPSWLAVGGDLRSVNIGEETENELNYEFIQMQKDLEISLSPYRGVWVGGSFGVYNDKIAESRRHYVIWKDVASVFNLRAGKYLVAYGLAGQDHTAFNRGRIGLGEGDESYNLEISAKAPLGQLFLSGIAATKETKEETGQTIYTSQNSGFAIRSTLFVLPKLQLGYSAMIRALDSKYGGFVSAAWGSWLYAGLDVNHVIVGEAQSNISYGKVSVDLYKGLLLVYENNFEASDIIINKNSIAIDWYPRPHIETMFRAAKQNGLLSYLALWHYYL